MALTDFQRDVLKRLADNRRTTPGSYVADCKALTDAREIGLPEYLQHDLEAFKEGVRTKSSLLDCLWGELYGSINGAEIDDQAITHEHAEYLRDKYLRRKLPC